MSSPGIWFLVAYSGLQWIGPLPEETCKMAAASISDQRVTCQAAKALTTCEAPHFPGSVMTCPVFDFPDATEKRP